ncbi:MAG: AAA domain-containing protein [Crocinitomicaceae bacterium]|nr:AAA domain-containing protein [Crocinitomicaceae bacterium]
MASTDPHIQYLLNQLKLEEKAQEDRYAVKDAGGIKALKRDGVALHPVRISRKTYGFAEYPECVLQVPLSQSIENFRDGNTIELFCEGETSIKGVLLSVSNKSIDVRLFAPDFPSWIDDGELGIKLTPDTNTQEIVRAVLERLDDGTTAEAYPFYAYLHQANDKFLPEPFSHLAIESERLNDSQNEAVKAMNASEAIVIVHGPPGTGKTTTLVEGIVQLVKNGEKVLVTAPSNAATDHIALELIRAGVPLMRLGNQTKVDSRLLPCTLEGKMAQGNEQKQIKKLRIQAEEFRKMAHQYKRHFGKDDRDQRKLLMQEVKNIRKEIRSLQAFYADKWIDEVSVICGTPIGLNDRLLSGKQFDTLVMDEAGQCLEPLAWTAIRNVQRLVLAGDHQQLPPTVISEEAIRNGFNKSFLEVVLEKYPKKHLLNTQYRMRQSIIDFPNAYFYDGQLQTPAHLQNTGKHFQFYDTAGTGFEEQSSSENRSLTNPGELEIIEKIMEQMKVDSKKCAFISPYAGQVALAKERFSKDLRISTIDSFQGQECETVFISLVRSNEDGKLGFLKDYRRLNVAFTRAQENLIIVGDSVTFGNDPFFKEFLAHCEEQDAYGSAWEFM